jgi:ABC-type lipoprotein export system ATPase subunit/GNAT superfamily N-acetyltransferase
MIIDKTFKLKFESDDFGYIDAFGLKMVHEFTPFKNLVIPDNPQYITMIVGESGSGKSQLTKILAEKWGFVEPNTPTDTTICCEFRGKLKNDVDECIYYLNYVGLSDAKLYYTPYGYLSDSQKFRARLAYTLLLQKNEKGYVIDEFLSTLDRETAKSVAFLFQKLARQKKIKLILTTAHMDLIEYTNPDLLIRGYAFPERFEIVDTISCISEPRKIGYNISVCDKEEYKNSRLGELHYRQKYTGGAKEYFKAHLHSDGSIIGFLVTAVVGKDSEMKRRIARVVVHPSYRGIGIGTELVKYYLKWAKENGIKKVFAVSALGMFNPFFEKGGMDRKKDYAVTPPMDFVNKLLKLGFDKDKWYSKDYCVEICKNQEIRNIVASLAKGAIRIVNPGGRKINVNEAKSMILSDESHAGRYLWTLRPRILARYEKKL